MDNGHKVFSITQFANSAPRPRKKSFSFTKKQIERVKEETMLMAEHGNWDDARGGHFVALYEWFYNKVYGFSPSDLKVNRMWAVAARMANEMREREFGNDADAVVEYMNWSWNRERQLIEWRKNNQIPCSPMTWRSQFRGPIVDKYRAYKLTKVG